MAEYIEKEAVMKEFAARVWRSNHSDFAPVPTWNQAVQIVEDFVAADVALVRHGRWIKKYDAVCYWHECSVCGEKPPKDQWKNQWLSSYCPSCGAKMDGEKRFTKNV